MLKERYKDYESALNILEKQLLKEMQESLYHSFAQKGLKNEKMNHWEIQAKSNNI